MKATRRNRPTDGFGSGPPKRVNSNWRPAISWLRFRPPMPCPSSNGRYEDLRRRCHQRRRRPHHVCHRRRTKPLDHLTEEVFFLCSFRGSNGSSSLSKNLASVARFCWCFVLLLSSLIGLANVTASFTSHWLLFISVSSVSTRFLILVRSTR